MIHLINAILFLWLLIVLSMLTCILFDVIDLRVSTAKIVAGVAAVIFFLLDAGIIAFTFG